MISNSSHLRLDANEVRGHDRDRSLPRLTATYCPSQPVRALTATTVEQIAETDEVSPRTFVRSLPRKDVVVRYADLDPLRIAAFEAQPAAVSPIPALRGARCAPGCPMRT